MSQDLLTNETHVTDFKGTLATARTAPVDGDEIDNIKEGSIYYNDATEDIYIFDGTNWYGAHATAS